MKKIIILVMFLSLIQWGFSGVGEIVVHENGTEYLCKVGTSTVIELPSPGEYSLDTKGNENWIVDLLESLVFISPKKPGNKLSLTITRNQTEIIQIEFRSVDEGDSSAKKIIVNTFQTMSEREIEKEKKKLEKEESKEPDPIKTVSEEKNSNSPSPQANTKKEKTTKSAPIIYDSLFSARGGIYNYGNGGKFSIAAEAVMAGETRKGIFGQAAVKYSNNPFIKSFGFSLGGGFEKKGIGVFLFADAMNYTVGEYESSFHLQIRPSFRLKYKRLAIAAFYAIGIGKGKVIDQVIENGETLDLVNDTLNHFGLELTGNLFDRMNARVTGLIAEAGYYRIKGSVEYNIWKNIDLTLQGQLSGFGDYPLIGDVMFSDDFRVSAGINFRLGESSVKFNDISTRLIFMPDYPIVAQKKVVPEDQEGETDELRVTLEANPTSGKVPLTVKFKTILSGGKSPYEIEWYFGPAQVTVSNMDINYEYTEVGVYNTFVKVTDATKKVAVSNIVMIHVTDKDTVYHKILASATSGGQITPSGEVTVEHGKDKSFSAIADPGYSVDYILIDEGAPKERKEYSSFYAFKNVINDHTIKAVFKEGGSTETFTVDTVAGTGGTISPPGPHTNVPKGTSMNFTITPDTGYDIENVIVNGETKGPIPTLNIIVDKNYVIEARFKKKMLYITATAGAGGIISPSGTVPVEWGSDQLFEITPSIGYQIKTVTVNGSDVTAQVIANSNRYTFQNIQVNGTINVVFEVRQLTVIALIGGSGTGGTISPYGTQTVNYGGSLSYTYTADPGKKLYSIETHTSPPPAGLISKDVRNNTSGSYMQSNITQNLWIVFYFENDALTFTWDSLNGNRKYMIRVNGVLVAESVSGQVQVQMDDIVHVHFTALNGQNLDGENVSIWDDVGYNNWTKGTSQDEYITIRGNTWITDNSSNRYFYQTIIHEGMGTILPEYPSGTFFNEGYSFTVNINANSMPQYTIDRIAINGVVQNISAPTHSFSITMNQDYVIEVWFKPW